jgi:hypothetical protein
MPKSSQCLFISCSIIKTLCESLLSHGCQMHRLSHPLLFHNINNIWWVVQIMKPSIQFSLPSYWAEMFSSASYSQTSFDVLPSVWETKFHAQKLSEGRQNVLKWNSKWLMFWVYYTYTFRRHLEWSVTVLYTNLLSENWFRIRPKY